jgi:hypothetical protein
MATLSPDLIKLSIQYVFTSEQHVGVGTGIPGTRRWWFLK